jgi:hypothetical protein
MALYMALSYYPEDQYWDQPDELRFAADYDEFKAAVSAAGVLQGGEALYPASSATTITVKGGKGGGGAADRRALRRGQRGTRWVLPH